MSEDNIIEVKNLVKEFRDFRAVDNISFQVKKGQIFGFLGPNGAGKSTTIKMLTTLLRPSSGEIIIDKKNAVTNPDAVRKDFGIVFQDPSVDDELTAWENMEFHGVLYSIPKKARREKIEQLLKVVELWDRKDEFVKHFSGGMRRRLEIARGLLHHPKVLFLDEPTLGLDPQTRNNIWRHICQLNRTEGITVFFTTHYIEEAEKVANHIYIIDHGKIIAQGMPKTLMKQTKSKSLESAFIKLTGRNIREEEATSLEKGRMKIMAEDERRK